MSILNGKVRAAARLSGYAAAATLALAFGGEWTGANAWADGDPLDVDLAGVEPLDTILAVWEGPLPRVSPRRAAADAFATLGGEVPVVVAIAAPEPVSIACATYGDLFGDDAEAGAPLATAAVGPDGLELREDAGGASGRDAGLNPMIGDDVGGAGPGDCEPFALRVADGDAGIAPFIATTGPTTSFGGSFVRLAAQGGGQGTAQPIAAGGGGLGGGSGGGGLGGGSGGGGLGGGSGGGGLGGSSSGAGAASGGGAPGAGSGQSFAPPTSSVLQTSPEAAPTGPVVGGGLSEAIADGGLDALVGGVIAGGALGLGDQPNPVAELGIGGSTPPGGSLETPIPAAGWLMIAGLAGLRTARRRALNPGP